MRRTSTASLLLLVPTAWVATFVIGAAPAAADDDQVSGYDKTWTTVDRKDWPKGGLPPIGEAVRKDQYGRYNSHYACFDFGPYPGVTQAAYGVTNIVLCGDVAVVLPQPEGVESPNGHEWGCWDPPDAVRFTVPFTLPRCDWGAGESSFAVSLDGAAFQDGLAKSAGLRTEAETKAGRVPQYTKQELQAVRREYIEGLQRFSNYDYEAAAEQEQIVRDTFETLANITPGMGAAFGAVESVTGEGIYSGKKLNDTERTLAALGAVTAVGAGLGAMKVASFKPVSVSSVGLPAGGIKGGVQVAGEAAQASAARQVAAANPFKQVKLGGGPTDFKGAVQQYYQAVNQSKTLTKLSEGATQFVQGFDEGVSIGQLEKTLTEYVLPDPNEAPR